MKNKKTGEVISLWAASLIIAVVFLGAVGYIVSAKDSQQANIFTNFFTSAKKSKSEMRQVVISCAQAHTNYETCMREANGDGAKEHICTDTYYGILHNRQCMPGTRGEEIKMLTCIDRAESWYSHCLQAGNGESTCRGSFVTEYLTCMGYFQENHVKIILPENPQS